MIVTPRNQPPVPLDQRPPRPHRLSFTWLSHYQRCKRSAYLYIEHVGGPASHEMNRGSIAHEAGQRLTLDSIDHGERFNGEMAKAALAEVYSEGQYTVDAREWDWLRVCCFHFGEHVVIDPESILGVEQLIVWDVGEWRISMRLDLAYSAEDDRVVGVDDYKTQRYVPTQEEFDQSFQTKLYALGLAFGHPVTVRECGTCEGDGTRLGDMGETVWRCPDCDAKGYTETVEPHPLGHGAEFFKVRERYLGILWDRDTPTEHIAYRERTLSRAELLDEKLMVEALLNQVSETFESGQWDAVPGDDQCGKCPARKACPLPDVLLPAPGLIGTPEEAEHYAMASFLLEQEKKDTDKALKAWNEDHGPIPLGDDYEYDVAPEKKTSFDRDKLGSDIEAGIAGPIEDYVTKSWSNRFMRRKTGKAAEARTAKEALSEASGNNGDGGAGESSSGSAPSNPDLDAKYGETLPV